MNTQNDFADAFNAIRRRTYIQTKLDLLDKIISRGDASRLVSEIIANERLACKTEGESVSRTMCNLEALATVSQEIACMLMASLWPLAASLRMHEICDSIDLWIVDCDSERLTHYLKKIAMSEEDLDKRDHYESLIQARSGANSPEGGIDKK
jgi:hypothetical protein